MSLNKNEGINSSDIFELIEQEDVKYSEYFYVYKMYQKTYWEKNQDKDDIASCIEVLINNVKNALESAESLEQSLALKKEKNNKLSLLKIKLMILNARIHHLLFCIDTNNETYLEIYTSIMQEMMLLEKPLNIKGNPIQKEIAYAVRIICTYGGENRIKGYDLARFGMTQWQYVKQYNDGIDKLEIYRDMSEFRGSLNNPMIPGDCSTIFETIDKEYGAKLNLYLETYEKVEYMRACFVIFQFSVKNYQTLTKITHKSDAEKLIYVVQREYEKYIPKIEACKNKMSFEEIVEDIDSLFDFQYFMSDFYEFLHDELTALKKNYDALAHTSVFKEQYFELIIKMRQFFIDIDTFNKTLNQQIHDKYPFDFFNVHFMNAHTNSLFLNEKDLGAFKTTHEETKKTSEADIAKAITASNANAKDLLATTSSKKQTSQKRRNNKSQNSAKLPTNTVKSQNKKKAEAKPPSSKPKSKGLELLESGSKSLTEKNHQDAISSFKKARQLELTLEEKLLALDGLIDAIQQNTLLQLNDISLEYGFCDIKIESTQKTISNAIKDDIYLDTLYLEFRQLVYKPESANLKTGQSELINGNLVLKENYLKIKAKIRQLHLIKDRKLAQKKWKQTLKNKKVKPITYMPPKVDAFPFAYEPKYREVPIPSELKEVVDFLSKVPGQHYLVGSMVLQLLLDEGEKLTFKPSDLDFLTLNSKREDWIKNGDFMEVTEEKHLYKFINWRLFQPFLPLEVWRVDKTKNLNECLLTRDFRLSALACQFIKQDDGSYIGKIIDPTGFGMEDFKLKRLVMIGNPVARIEKSPSIILRAIKYLFQEIAPCQSIFDAMHTWQPNDETNLSKLGTLSLKIFSKCDKLEFAKYLIQFQLQVKLLNLSPHLNATELVDVLEESLKKYSKKNRFFQNSENANIETSVEQLELTK